MTPPTWFERHSRYLTIGAVLLVLLVVFRQIVLPFTFGLLIAYLLLPLVRRLARRVSRGGAVLVIYLCVLALLSGFVGVLIPGVLRDFGRLRESTPPALTRIDEVWLPKFVAWFEDATGASAPAEAGPTASEVIIHPQPDGTFRVDLGDAHLEVHESGSGWIIEAKPRQPERGVAALLRDLLTADGDDATWVRSVAAGVASFLTDLLIAFLVAAYVLIDLARIQKWVRGLVLPDHRDEFDELVDGLDQGMAGMVRGQLLICLINGALTWAGLMVFGVKYSLLLALLAAILSLVPIFGSLLSALPIMGVALVSNDIVSDLAFGKSLGILGWLIGIHLLEANWLNPKIIGTTAHIHPVIVVFALLTGYTVFGAAGALLAIPAVSLIQTGFILSRRRSEEFAGRSGVLAAAAKDVVDRAGDD